MIIQILGHEMKIFLDVTSTVINKASARDGGENIRGSVEDSRVGYVHEEATVVTENASVKRFASLTDDKREKAVGDKKIINPGAAAGIGRLFAFKAVTIRLNISE